MWPIIYFDGAPLEVFGRTIETYYLCLAAGILVSLATLFFAARRRRVRLDFFADNFWILALATIVSSRLVFVLLQNYSLLHFPFFWEDKIGFSFWGGVIGYFAALAWLTRRHHENFLLWFDISALATAAGLIFHHLGTWLAGSAYGSPTTAIWGVTFTDPHAAVLTTLPVHPTQILSLAATIIFFFAGLVVLSRTRKNGKVGAFLLLTLSLSYFAIDFLRGDSAVMWGPLRASQYFELAAVAAAFAIVWRIKHTRARSRVDEISIHSHH